VKLDGSGSRDAEGIIVAYFWTKTDRRGKTIDIARGATPAVELEVGSHKLTLTVVDTDGYTATDTVTVNVSKKE
jgi:hypothetical protein